MELIDLIALLPEDEYAVFAKETQGDDYETVKPFPSLSLFHRCPEDGWRNRAAYFHHGGEDEQPEEDFPWKHDDALRWAVTGSYNQLTIFQERCIRALKRHLAKLNISTNCTAYHNPDTTG